jgi:hypothetical protein
MPRSCGFFAEDGGLYGNIVNFQLAFLKQIIFVLCLLRIQIQVDLPLIFQAVNGDSIALTTAKIRCRST